MFSALVFPVTVLAIMGSATWLLTHGFDPGLVLGSHSVLSALVLSVLERLHPHEPRWFGSRGDVGPDWLHLLVSNFGVARLGDVLVVPFAFYLAVSLTGEASPLWPTSLPLPAQGMLALAIAELPYYWWHRLAHEHPILWRLHAIHHSAPRLYWLNAARFHPLDAFIGYTIQTIPLIVLGCDEIVLSWCLLLTALHGLFQHANIRVRLGPLNWVFSMSELHRWHHSTLEREGNTNYGGNLILWDVVFGTRFLPPDRSPPLDIGIGGMPHFPKSYLGQLLAPFRWQQTLAASSEPPESPPS